LENQPGEVRKFFLGNMHQLLERCPLGIFKDPDTLIWALLFPQLLNHGEPQRDKVVVKFLEGLFDFGKLEGKIHSFTGSVSMRLVRRR
jgi:hypothetical protein